MWKLLRVTFSDPDQLRLNAFEVVGFVESKLSLSELYFARYVGNAGAYIQISFDSEGANLHALNELSEHFSFITDFSITNRDSGGLIHSLGYRICKALNSAATGVDKDLSNVIHWMHNMLGYSYCEEEANYRRWADGISNRQRI